MSTTTMTQTFTLQRATIADMASCLEVSDAAYGNSPHRRAAYPERLAHLTSPEDLREWRVGRVTKMLTDPRARNFKIVVHDGHAPEDGKAIAFATWRMPNYNWEGSDVLPPGEGTMKVVSATNGDVNDSQESTSGQEAAPADGRPKADKTPKCVDVDFINAQSAEMNKLRKETWGEDTNFLCMLAPPKIKKTIEMNIKHDQ